MKEEARQSFVRRLVARIAGLPRGAQLALVAAPLVILVAGFAMPVAALEKLETYITLAIGFIANTIVSMIGQLLLLMVGVMINIAQYNDFVTARPVAIGWVIVRDLTNMFFILVLLVIAFSTMLGLQKTGDYRQALPRLIIIAIIINFSRTLVGLMIDFSQVVMLTFVNGFSAAAGGNFVSAFKVNEILTQASQAGSVTSVGSASTTVNLLQIVVTAMLAIVNVSVSLGVVIIITSVLIIRIVYLWLLTILSPLAFLMKAVPSAAASKYYGEWWGMFTSNIITGPVLAFFLWLSLLVAADTAPLVQTHGGSGEQITAGIGQAFQQDRFQSFVVSVALMLGGVMIAKRIGGAGVGFGADLANKARKTATGVLKKGALYAGRGALNVADRGVGGLLVGRGATVSGLAKTRYEQVKESGVGKALGLNKDFNENRKGEQQVATLRAVGKHDKADLLEKELVGTRSKQLSKTRNIAQLIKLAEDKKADKYDRQGALLAIAEDGDDYLKGKGKEINAIVAGVGGGKALNSQIRKALKANGDTDASRGAPDTDPVEDIKEELRGSRPHELDRRFASISKGVSLGTDRKPKRTHAIDELNALSKDQFDDLRADVQDEVKKALLLARENETDSTKKDKILDKYNELLGNAVGTALSGPERAEAAKFKSQQDSKLVLGQVAAKVTGQERERPLEAAARDVVRTGLGGVEFARKRYDDLDKLQRSAASGTVPTVGDLNTIQSAIVTEAGLGLSGAFDEAGRELTREEVVKQSQFYRDLESAKQAIISGQTKSIDKFLQSAKLQFQQSVNDRFRTGRFSEKELIESERLNKLAKIGLDAGVGTFDSAVVEVDTGKRVDLVRQAVSQLETSLKKLGQLRASSPETQTQIGELRDELKKLRKSKSIEVGEVTRINDVKKRIDSLKKQV